LSQLIGNNIFIQMATLQSYSPERRWLWTF